MRFFLDTANLDEIGQAMAWGVVAGVTTNPTLVSKEGNLDFFTRVREIAEIVKGPVSAEVISLDTPGMVREARELAALSPHVVVKVPMTPEGMGAVRILSEEGINTNVTLVFSSPQAILAAAAGATYVSPFVGRLDDVAHDGMELCEQIIQIFDNYDFSTEIIVASIRHPRHVLAAAMMGADIATIPFKVINQLAQHPLTDKGINLFLEDWKKVPQK